MTLECAWVMGLTLFVLTALLYLSFYLYDVHCMQTILQEEAMSIIQTVFYYKAEDGKIDWESWLEGGHKEGEIQVAREKIYVILSDKLYFMKGLQTEVWISEERIYVKAKAEFQTSFIGILLFMFARDSIVVERSVSYKYVNLIEIYRAIQILGEE